MSFRDELAGAVKAGPSQKIAGAVVIAANTSGDIIYSQAAGVKNVETKEPMTEDTTFWIASCTKLITTIAALQCVERGLLVLDEDISTILPQWKSPDILTGFNEETGEPILKKAQNKITLRQLLTHSAGMGYDFLSPILMKWREYKGEQVGGGRGDVENFYNTPLVYEPGEGWEYSVSIDWAGKMVEHVNGGIRLGEYMKKNIFDPLGMTSTTFRLPEHELVRKNLCSTTARGPEGDLSLTKPYAGEDLVDDLGGGGLYSSAPDYLKILVSLLRNDGVLLRPETVKQILTPQLQDPKYLVKGIEHPMLRGGIASFEFNWGLGGILNTSEVEGICHSGTLSWGGLPNLFWALDPASGTCAVYASQLLPPGDPQSMELWLEFRKEIFRVAKQK